MPGPGELLSATDTTVAGDLLALQRVRFVITRGHIHRDTYMFGYAGCESAPCCCLRQAEDHTRKEMKNRDRT
jgi:hypothetical protein